MKRLGQEKSNLTPFNSRKNSASLFRLPWLLAAIISFTFLPMASAIAQRCEHMAAVDYSSHDRTVQRLRQIYRAGNFQQLDETLSCLIQSPEQFHSGKPGSSAVYWLFRREMPAPGVNPTVANHLSKWRQERPNSIFVRFAELRLQYATAWNARGSDFAQKVPAEGMRLFKEGLSQTEKDILTSPAELRANPILQNLLLALVLDMTDSKTNPRIVFEESVKRWPKYYDFYEVALSRLTPRWGGSWDAVDAFIVYWSKYLAMTEGDSMYARLYTNIVSSGANIGETRISWPRMKVSLDELVSKYPDTLHKNLAASYACHYQDIASLKVFIRQMKTEEFASASWLPGTTPETCLRMAGLVRP